MKRLIKDNPNGFCTSHLYREVYHTMPIAPEASDPQPKPLLFDQARHSLGRIWLRPQVSSEKLPKATEDGRYLKLTFRLNQDPDLAVMNELALQLQFLPHVDQIRFEDLYAPREQITGFLRLVLLASKLKPLVRKLHARRQRRKIQALAEQTEEKATPSLIELHMEHSHRPACDWSSASQVVDHDPKHTQDLLDRRERLGPLVASQENIITTNGLQLHDQPRVKRPLDPDDKESADTNNRKRPRSGSPHQKD